MNRRSFLKLGALSLASSAAALSGFDSSTFATGDTVKKLSKKTLITASDDMFKHATSAGSLGVDGNIFIDPITKTIGLKNYGSVNEGVGVSLGQVNAYLKKAWLEEESLISIKKPIQGITPELFDFKDGWKLADDDAIGLIRGSSFSYIDSDGDVTDHYTNFTSLGTPPSTVESVMYYQRSEDGESIPANRPGAFNQAIKNYSVNKHDLPVFIPEDNSMHYKELNIQYHKGDVVTISGTLFNDGKYVINEAYPGMVTFNTDNKLEQEYIMNGNINVVVDNRDFFKLYSRAPGYLPCEASTKDIGVTNIDGSKYYLPMHTCRDLMQSGELTDYEIIERYRKYVNIDYKGNVSSASVGLGVMSYDTLINVRPGTMTIYELYEYLTALGRTDMPVGNPRKFVKGRVSELLVSFIGTTLVTNPGVFINGLRDADINSVEFTSIDKKKHRYPFIYRTKINIRG